MKRRDFITLLGGAGEQRRRDFEAERAGGLEIDDHLDLGRKFDRQIAGFCAFQNLVDKRRGVAGSLDLVDAVTHEAAGFDSSTVIEYRRQSRGERLPQDRAALIDEQPVGLHDQDLRPSLRNAIQCGREPLGPARFLYKRGRAARAGGGNDLGLDQRPVRAGWIDQKPDAHQPGNSVMRQFDQLCIHAFDNAGNAGDAAGGPRVAGEEIGKVVAKDRADDRQVGRERLHRTSRARLAGKHHVWREHDEFACERPQTFRIPLRITIVDVERLPSDVSQLAHARDKGGNSAPFVLRREEREHGDVGPLPGRMHRKRPRDGRAAEERDEVATVHSMISSASRRNGSGIVSPSALAVLRFTTSSNFVGCSTGKSAGRVPRKILST